jgi:hypothetical protein
MPDAEHGAGETRVGGGKPERGSSFTPKFRTWEARRARRAGLLKAQAAGKRKAKLAKKARKRNRR